MDGNAPSTEDTIKYPRMRYAVARVWADNPRKVVTGIDELAASIATKDIIEPLIVRALEVPDGEITHEVLAGQRRYLAGQKAGLNDFPYILRQLDDAEALELALIENNQRVDPSPLEDAEAIHRRMADPKHACTAEYLADRLGRRVEWVKGRLALLGLCDEAKAWLRDGKLPITHAQKLAAVDTDTQRRVVEKFKNAPELPAAKQFAHEITYALHLLSGAPFDADDAKLPGGACAKCPKRSDTQPDLFDTGRGAHCLDNTCWNGKVTAIWERAQKDAKKRHLDVLTDEYLVRDGYGDDPAYVVWGKPYDVKPAQKGDAPVAIARTPRGAVVELYAKPVKKSGDDGDELEALEDEQDDNAATVEEARKAWLEERAAKDAERQGEVDRVLEERAAKDAERQGEVDRVLVLLRENRAVFSRLALEEVEANLYVDPHALSRLARAVGVELDASASRTDTRALVRKLPDDAVVDVLLAYVVLGHLTQEPSENAPEWETRVRELVAGKPQDEALTRVWIREQEWDGLSENGREVYAFPDVDREIRWEGREGVVTARVGATDLEYLRTMASEDGITLHEGEEPPPAPAPKPSKKPARKKAAGRPAAEPVEVEQPEAPVDEPVKPKAGELVFFAGKDSGHAIERITATHLVVDVDGMEYLVPRDTLSWRSRWQTSETKPKTTTLRASQADWQKHKSGLQDTSTGLLHKKWNAEGEDRVAVFPCGAGIYDRVLQYARKHAIELYVGAREATNRVSPLDPPAALAKKSRSKKGAK